LAQILAAVALGTNRCHKTIAALPTTTNAPTERRAAAAFAGRSDRLAGFTRLRTSLRTRSKLAAQEFGIAPLIAASKET